MLRRTRQRRQGASGSSERRSLSPRSIAAGISALILVGLGASALWLTAHDGGAQTLRWAPVAVIAAAALLALSLGGVLPAAAGACAATWLGPGAIAALVGLSAASLLWTASPTLTVTATARLALAALILALAVIACRGAALATLAIVLVILVSSAAGLLVVAQLLAGETGVFRADRLSYPIGYANGAAALLLMGVPAAVALGGLRRGRAAVSGALAACAALLAASGFLTVSRGGLVALAVAIVVTVVVAPSPARVAAMALAVALAVTAAAPLLLAGPAASVDAVRTRGLGVVLAGALAAGMGFAIARARVRLVFPAWRRGMRRAAIALAAVGLTSGGAAFVIGLGGPVSAIDALWAEFRGDPMDPPSQVTDRLRSVQSNRSDYWRVALETWRDDPLLGAGAGAFPIRWYRERAVPEDVANAHGWPFDLASELGAGGVALFVLLPLAVAAAARALRGEGQSPRASAGVAATGAAAYFLTHAAIDWLLQIPAVLVLGMLACGAALGAANRPASGLARGRSSIAAGTGAALALALVVPLWISERYLHHATSATETRAALAAAAQAESWNRLSIAPLQHEAEIRVAAGDLHGAERALREAVADEPRRWEPWAQLARVYAAMNRPREERAALDRVRALNPLRVGPREDAVRRR